MIYDDEEADDSIEDDPPVVVCDCVECCFDTAERIRGIASFLQLSTKEYDFIVSITSGGWDTLSERQRSWICDIASRENIKRGRAESCNRSF